MPTLSGITLGSGLTLNPAFDPSETSYQISVPSAATYITITVEKPDGVSWGATGAGNSYGMIEYTRQDETKTTVQLSKSTPDPDSYEITVAYTAYNAVSATVNVFVSNSVGTEIYSINTTKQ